MTEQQATAHAPHDEMRRLVPLFALAAAVVSVLADPAPGLQPAAAVVPVVAFGWWAFAPRMPLWLLTLAVLVPVVLAQRSGDLEPLLFEASLLSLVIGRWSPSWATAAGLGLLAAAAAPAAALLQDPAELSSGIWILGIAFPWLIGRAAERQAALTAQLEATRGALAEQALMAERRRIARDVHDFVGHGLAAMMLQVTSARHVLRRDPDGAEEALRAAEDVGRRSMGELRRTVALLRSDGDESLAALPSAQEIPALVDEARAGGLAIELRVRGDLSRMGPATDAALYRIAQEALANAARHAPKARTIVALHVDDDRVRLAADTLGVAEPSAGDDGERPRYGVIGMRERAATLGGELTAAATPEGWRLRCTLPLDAGALPADRGARA